MPSSPSEQQTGGPFQADAEGLEDIAAQVRQGAVELTPEFLAAHAEKPAQPPSGGDFHAAFPVGDGTGDVAVVIGDVSGHGPEQTAQADHMRELLSDSLSAGLTPGEALGAVNAMIEPDPNFVGFSTVFVGKLEGGTGKLTYSSGGHEPGLIATPDADAPAQVEQLEGTGPPVGAFPPGLARYEQKETILPPGATLLLYTDGVSDAHPLHDRQDWFGIERLKGVLARFAALSPRRLVSALLRRVARFCGGRFEDDIAVMAVRRRRFRFAKTPGSDTDPARKR